MRQFVAILKDSFREAVDGFVIYLMLGLSALMVALAASVSYRPAPAADALPELLPQFNLVFPDSGASPLPTGSGTVAYTAGDIQETPNGARFVLKVDSGAKPDAKPEAAPDAPKKNGAVKKDGWDKKDPPGPDGFRGAVFAWKSPPGEKIKNPLAGRDGRAKGRAARGELEILQPPRTTPADLRAVTDDDMAAFLKSQFAAFGGVSDVAVTRRPGVPEPGYEFDVEVKGVAGAKGWPHDVHTLFGLFPPIRRVPLGLTLFVIQDQIVNGVGAGVALMISVVITAFFIPNLLRKGSVDLLISKPIGRSQLLVYKYVGGLTFIFLVSAVTIGGAWLVMAIRSGMWDPTFLLVIPILTFSFAILYAVSTLVAVLTRSAIAAILVTLAFMLLMWLLGQTKSAADANRVAGTLDVPEWGYALVDGLNNALPRYKDVDKITSRLVAESTMPTGLARLNGIFTDYPSWTGAVGVSLAFIAVMLLLSCWRFSRRDY